MNFPPAYKNLPLNFSFILYTSGCSGSPPYAAISALKSGSQRSVI